MGVDHHEVIISDTIALDDYLSGLVLSFDKHSNTIRPMLRGGKAAEPPEATRHFWLIYQHRSAYKILAKWAAQIQEEKKMIPLHLWMEAEIEMEQRKIRERSRS